MKLPKVPGTAAPDGADALAAATAACRAIRTLTAEAGMSGSVGRDKVRGRLTLGVARPASARIEALAPFGAPVFIFAARDGSSTLLLPRDEKILEDRADAVLQ